MNVTTRFRSLTRVFCILQNARLAIEQSAQLGADFKGCYRKSDLGNVMKLLQQKGWAVIMMPIVTLCSNVYQYQKNNTDGLKQTLEALQSPDVHIVLDEVHELVNKNKFANKVAELRDEYLSNLHLTGVSATPPSPKCKTTQKLFGARPRILTMSQDDEESLLKSINGQHHLSQKKDRKYELTNTLDGEAEKLNKHLCIMVVGNALFSQSKDCHIKHTCGIKHVLGELLACQLHGDKLDGGVLFKKTQASKVTMNKKNGNTWEPVEAYQTLVVAHALHLVELQDLQNEPDVRSYTVYGPQNKSYKDSAAREDALDKFHEASFEQKGLTIGIIDKCSTSGSNDFSKNVHVAVAVGPWKEDELTQFKERMGRSVPLIDGDCVPQEFVCMHFDSKFATDLLMPKKECLNKKQQDEMKLSVDEKAALEGIDLTMSNGLTVGKCTDTIMHLKALKLTPDPVVKYLECMKNQAFKDKFKDEEYDPLLSSLFKVEDNMEDEGDDEDDVDGEGGDDVEGQGGATVG